MSFLEKVRTIKGPETTVSRVLFLAMELNAKCKKCISGQLIYFFNLAAIILCKRKT